MSIVRIAAGSRFGSSNSRKLCEAFWGNSRASAPSHMPACNRSARDTTLPPGVCVAALGMRITPIARVTSHDPHDATRILDCGAQGVMVPHVQNADEARAIVEACRFAPESLLEGSGFEPSVPRKVPGISTVSALVRAAFPLAG